MRLARPAIAVGLATLAVVLALSLREAAERIASFPRHRGYQPPSGFIHYDIGGPAGIEQATRDPEGVLVHDYGGSLGRQYNPLFVADFVLALVPYRDDPQARRLLRVNLDWLLASAETTPGGNLLFPYRFDFAAVGETAPWYSAMAQARIGQALLWGERLMPGQGYQAAARRAILAIAEGAPGQALAKPLRNGVWLTEFPRYRFQVLDGSLVAIVGVSEVLRGLPADDPGRARIAALLRAARAGLVSNQHCFTTPAGGLYFADDGKLPSQAYYDIIMDQLAYLAADDPAIAAIARRYSLEGLPYWRRLAIYYGHRLRRSLIRAGLAGPCVR